MIGKLRAVAKKFGYKIYSKPYKLNIWGVRSPVTKAGVFDDFFIVFYNAALSGLPSWKVHVWKCTTDPGTYWLKNPMRPEGTAILKQGQWHGYKIGMHRGSYEAIVQRSPVTVIRDYNRDSTLDFNNGKEHHGMFGINIHPAGKGSNGVTLYKASAGCQVFARRRDFDALMNLAKIHERFNGNSFTYTLIDLRSLKRVGKQKTAAGALAFVGAGAALGWLYWRFFGEGQKEWEQKKKGGKE